MNKNRPHVNLNLNVVARLEATPTWLFFIVEKINFIPHELDNLFRCLKVIFTF
jgi:hypothetical protein